MKKKYIKLLAGIAVSLFFLILALWKVDFLKICETISRANYWTLFPSILVLGVNLYLRTFRWKILMKPVKRVPMADLFKSLLIGYAGNNILPAHLGEFLRAYMTGKKSGLSMTSVFTTIVVERIIDMLCLIIMLSLAMLVYPFPEWVKKSGIIILAFTFLIVVMISVLKYKRETILGIFEFILKAFPEKLHDAFTRLVDSFLQGLKPLDEAKDYVLVIVISALLWGFYIMLFYINFYTFGLVEQYQLSLIPALVLVVITTISVVIPSSPGYIGTFHWLCQLTFILFNISPEVGLSYGIVVHAVNYIPILFTGIILAWREGVHFAGLSKDSMLNDR